MAPAEAASDADAAPLAAHLASLRREPDNDDERAASFTVFSSYLDTVGTLRTHLHDLWDRSRGFFDPAGAAAMTAKVAQLDGAEALSVEDYAGVWIVHGMATRALANHRHLARVTRDMETKLSLLSAELGDCPMCLERLGAEATPARTLACCHRVCVPCWEQWVLHLGPRGAFCPLCRHVDFLGEVTHAAGTSLRTVPV